MNAVIYCIGHRGCLIYIIVVKNSEILYICLEYRMVDNNVKIMCGVEIVDQNHVWC